MIILSYFRKDKNSCQLYPHFESESLCIYGLIFLQRFYIAKYTNTLKEGLYRSFKQCAVLIKVGQKFSETTFEDFHLQQ